MGIKSNIALFFIFWALVFLLQIFFLTPFSIVGIILLPIFAVFGFAWFLLNPSYLGKRIKRWLFTFLILMVISITASYVHLNQDILSGIIGNKSFLELGAVLFIYYLMLRYNIKSKRVIRLIKRTSWVLFVIYVILWILDIKFTFVSVFTGSTVDMEVAKLRNHFVNLGSILYLGMFFYRKDTKFLILSLILFSVNMLGDFQRFIFLTYIVTLVSGFFIYKQKSMLLKFLPYTLVLVFAGILISSYTDYGSVIEDKYRSAFSILDFTPTASSDGSVNARVWESTYALKEFFENPIFGKGNPRASAMQQIVGDLYFHLSDIGLIGLLYSFGIVGLIVYFFQLRESKLLKPFNERALGLKLSMVFIIFYTILTGFSVFEPAFFFILLMLYDFEEREHAFAISQHALSEKLVLP